MSCNDIIELEILEDEANMELDVDFQGDIIRLGGGDFIETDPTVPDWAKQLEKPKYTPEEIGTLSIEQIENKINRAINEIELIPGPKGDSGYTPIKGVDYFDGEQGPRGEVGPVGPKGDKGDQGDPATNIIQSVNGKTGIVQITTEDIGALSSSDVDKTYNPESDNPLSGKAVKEAIDGIKPDIISAGTFNTIEELQNYDFEENKVYNLFVPADSELGSVFGGNTYLIATYVVDVANAPDGSMSGLQMIDKITGRIFWADFFMGDIIQLNEGSGEVIVDQTYKPTSSNAQSGTAIEEALNTVIYSIDDIRSLDVLVETVVYRHSMRNSNRVVLAWLKNDLTDGVGGRLPAGVYFCVGDKTASDDQASVVHMDICCWNYTLGEFYSLKASDWNTSRKTVQIQTNFSFSNLYSRLTTAETSLDKGLIEVCSFFGEAKLKEYEFKSNKVYFIKLVSVGKFTGDCIAIAKLDYTYTKLFCFDVKTGKRVLIDVSPDPLTVTVVDNDQKISDIEDDVQNIFDILSGLPEGKTILDLIAEASYDDTELSARVSANEDNIAILAGDGEGSVKKTVDNAFNDFATKVSNDGVVNTYKELVDYAAQNGAEMATLVGIVNKLEGFVGNTSVSDQIDIKIDQTFKSTSSNAQSGTAIAQELNKIVNEFASNNTDMMDYVQEELQKKADKSKIPKVDDEFSATSTNAQSGVAVAQALEQIGGSGRRVYEDLTKYIPRYESDLTTDGLESVSMYIYYPNLNLPATTTMEELKKALVGDIDTALDELHTYAQSLISGGVEE